MLTHLAPEIVYLILDYLPTPDLISLRSTCRTLLPALTQRVFSEISFDLSWPRARARRQLRLIQSIVSDPQCTIPSFVTTLRIAALHLEVDHHGESQLPDENCVRAILSEFLSPCISKLRNLVTVCWTHNLDRDPPNLPAPVAEALSSLPLLKALALVIEGKSEHVATHQLPPLHCFKDLHTFSVTCCGDIPQSYCEEEIEPVIEASPALTNFTLRNCTLGRSRVPIECISLQQFFHAVDLSELRQLELKHVPLPSSGLRDKLSLSSKLLQLSVKTRPGSRGIDFDWATLWSSLQDTKTKLSALRVSGGENAMDRMFDYLLTYSGLQKLEILNVQMDHEDQENSAAQILWNKVIPNHKDTLVTLAITAKYQGAWCYGSRVAYILSQCRALRDLTLSLGPVDSSWADMILSQARENQKIEFLYLKEPHGLPENGAALVVCSLGVPLRKLTLELARTPTSRVEDMRNLNNGWPSKGTPQAYFALQRMKQALNDLEAVVLGVRGPAAAMSNWPWVVEVNWSTLQICRGNEPGTLQYERDTSKDDD